MNTKNLSENGNIVSQKWWYGVGGVGVTFITTSNIIDKETSLTHLFGSRDLKLDISIKYSTLI